MPRPGQFVEKWVSVPSPDNSSRSWEVLNLSMRCSVEFKMPRKRGRPLSDNIDDPALLRRREAWRRQKQNRRTCQRAHTASKRPTQEQLQQGEQIINLAFIAEEEEEEDATVTSTPLGLRVQGIALAQDFDDAQHQQHAVPRNEHINPCPTTERASVESSQHPKTASGEFFERLTTRDAFSSNQIHQNGDRSVSYPSRESQRSSSRSSRSSAVFMPDMNSMASLPDANEITVQESPVVDEDGYSDVHATVEERPEDNIQTGVEETGYSFVSERSVHSDGEELDQQPSALEYMKEKLYDQLINGFHGCSQQQHDEKLREHMEAAGDNHYSLDEIFNDANFPSVLGVSNMMSPEQLAQYECPNRAQWEAMFCGTTRGHRLPKNVCIHQEKTQAVVPHVSYDFDSLLCFPTTLAVASRGLWWQTVAMPRQNMTTDVHVETNVYLSTEDTGQPVRTSQAMLRDVPHMFVGRVAGAHDITMHILFPHMDVANEKFVALTKEQQARFADQVCLPAIHKYYDSHYTQHLPASFRHAFANSKAHQVEARMVQTASYQAQQSIGYHLQPEYLDQIWSDMLETIQHTPGLADFREPQLFLGAKGTKLQFKTNSSRPTLLDAMEYFQSFLEDVLDFSYVDKNRLYVDLGKEICPEVSLLSSQSQRVGDEPQVYLPKRCCEEQYMKWMYDDKPPKLGRGQLYFSQNMLYDAGSLTSVTPKRSLQREGGLIYTQVYSPVKGWYDATKCIPFSNDGMEEMALDPQIRHGARQAAGGRRRDAKIIEQAHLASKARTRDALRDSRKKSASLREEHRIRWDLFEALQARLRMEDHESLDIRLVECPSYAWAIKSSVYADFLWRSVDKFATGFELMRAKCHREYVTWEQTKMMAMFLRCLRYVLGGHLLSRESALWWSRRERSIGDPARLRIWYGLGFCNTLPQYGYCWLEPRIDWSRLQFKSEVTDEVLFGNSVLRGQYLRRGGQVQEFFDTTRRMELALEWLGRYKATETVRRRMIKWIIHICLQQFRKDVLSCVKTEIMEERREEVLQSSLPFSFDALEDIMVDGVYLMSGNRCDFKVVSHLGQFLFNFGDGRIRNHWEDRPFRKLYRRAVVGLGLQGREIQQSFVQGFWRALYQYHWVLPYPCKEALMQTTKEGRRMWYSIRAQEGVEAREAEEKDWWWARKSWEGGRPKSVPGWMEWGKEEWERWIEERHGAT